MERPSGRGPRLHGHGEFLGGVSALAPVLESSPGFTEYDPEFCVTQQVHRSVGSQFQ
jgi:hypothetical protein